MAPQISHQISNISIFFERYTKFFCSAIFEGTISFISPSGNDIQSISTKGENIVAENSKIISKHPRATQQKSTKFRIQVLLKEEEFPNHIEFLFSIENSGLVRAKWSHPEDQNPLTLVQKFKTYLGTGKCSSLLDIGGRARSGLLRSEEFKNLHVEVLDIIPGEGVTTVCDAHKMSSALGLERFDAVFSIFVFEHLAMPWKVAVEMNRVMKYGAQACVVTHQSVGMHDMPWDFFRFSDTAWKALFNKYTGFEIIETELQSPNFIIPFKWSPHYVDAEKACGFEYSTVLVKKISDATLDWPLQVADITDDFYPLGVDPSISKLKI